MMRTLLVVLTALTLAGCSVMPRSVLKEVDRAVTLDMVQAGAERHAGAKVLWGGIILGSENLEEVTEIEVLETELGFDERPENGSSKGRFIIQARGYLDTTIYAKNKRVTVAGTVKGVERRKIGKMNYPYPVVEPLELRSFEQLPDRRYYDPYYYGSPYGPYYPYGPAYPYSPYDPYGPFRQPFYPYPYPYPFP